MVPIISIIAGGSIAWPGWSASHDEDLAAKSIEAIEDGLNEIFQIMRHLENRDLLTETRGARPLALDRSRRNGPNAHAEILPPGGITTVSPVANRRSGSGVTSAKG